MIWKKKDGKRSFSAKEVHRNSRVQTDDFVQLVNTFKSQ
jgi:hypothetical protein